MRRGVGLTLQNLQNHQPMEVMGRHKAALDAFERTANEPFALSGMEFFIVDYDFVGNVRILFFLSSFGASYHS